MTLPRRVVAGQTVMITRRCALRMFLLRPSVEVELAFAFCLAHAATLYGVQVHGYQVLSNHYHLIVTDVRGKLPEFVRWLNGHVARALNVVYGRGESFWSPGSYSAVVLGDEEAVFDKLVYVATNAVAAGLVPEPAEWPGLRSLPEDVGALTLAAARPSFFFRKAEEDEASDDSARARRRRRDPERDLLPERARVAITKPPQFADMTDEAFRAELAERVAARVREIHVQRAKEGHRGWLGAAAARLQHWSDHPGVQSPTGSLNPRIACKDKWRRVELLSQQVSFWQEYHEARVRYLAGERNVVFPEGTYWFKVHFRVRCRSAA